MHEREQEEVHESWVRTVGATEMQTRTGAETAAGHEMQTRTGVETKERFAIERKRFDEIASESLARFNMQRNHVVGYQKSLAVPSIVHQLPIS